MIRPYLATNFIEMFDLVERAVEEVPEWSFLPGAISSQPNGFHLWQAGDVVAGFLFCLAPPIRALAALYLLPEFRDEASSFIEQAVIEWKCDPETRAILVPEKQGPCSVSLAFSDFERIVRLELVQDLNRVTVPPIELPDGYRIEPWNASFAPHVARILSEGSRGTHEGLFLCFPEMATEEACQALLDRLVSGEMGTFLTDATGVLLAGNEVAGIALMFSPNPGEAMLWELALGKDCQAKGLAVALIRHLQGGTKQAGLGLIRFAYCEKNRAVRRLFGADTIVSHNQETMWIWRSQAYRALRRPEQR